MAAEYIDIHTHSPRQGVRCILAYSIGMDAAPPPSGTVFSAGVHPWSAATADIAAALGYLETAPLIAIGEIGLDRVRPVDLSAQQRVLELQLDIARRRGLPVILHCVKAYNEVLATLGNYNLRGVVFHGYTGSPEQTDIIMDKGYYISAGDVSLKSPKTVESFRKAPLGRIFAETDTASTDIRTIYAGLAALKGITLDELAGAIENNYKKVFG